MPVLNYTTTVATDRTVGQVQKLLADAGANAIALRYVDGRPAGLEFQIPTAFGPRTFSLPVDSWAVLGVLEKDPRVQGRYCTEAHAERVAWRIIKDWLEAQLAIIETEMVTLDQVMLPYMHDDGGHTVWELYRDRVPQLGSGEDQ